MKKLVITLCLALSTQASFAQMEEMGEVFHTGEATEKASEKMAQDMMTAMIAAAASAKDGKEMSEEQMAEMMFEGMKKHSAELKTAMQTDCAVDNDAKDCGCFYEKVDMNKFFDGLKEAALKAKTEEDVEKSMKPLIEDVKAKKAQCNLK